MTDDERNAALRDLVRQLNGPEKPEPEPADPETTPQAPPRSSENTQYKGRPPAGMSPEMYNAYLQTLRGLRPDWNN